MKYNHTNPQVGMVVMFVKSWFRHQRGECGKIVKVITKDYVDVQVGYATLHNVSCNYLGTEQMAKE
jgi:hypothetical protein